VKVENTDLVNCCDEVAHPITAIALQSFRDSLLMVAMMLSVLQDMDFFLHTAFGESAIMYGDT